MQMTETGKIHPLGKSDLLRGQGFPLTLISQYWHVYVAGNIQQKLSHQKEQRAVELSEVFAKTLRLIPNTIPYQIL